MDTGTPFVVNGEVVSNVNPGCDTVGGDPVPTGQPTTATLPTTEATATANGAR